ncbi:MAG: hypothetical protein Q8N53_07655 [Longimicrobiales bacterium]|nr:hypothetical protein [Longimicrobiales bacterium]
MIPYAAYKTIHYIGIFTLVVALSASLARSAQGGADPDPWRKRLGILHGVALFAILVGGFGMLARLEMGFPGWIVAKLAIWLVVGGLIALRKGPAAAGWALAALPLLAALAGWIAYVKPF